MSLDRRRLLGLAALAAGNAPAVLFPLGGHGLGLRKAVGKPVAVWPELWHA